MKPQATMKSYPIKEKQKNQLYWAEGQEVKRVTIRFVVTPTQDQMDDVFEVVTNLGFGSLDKNTFIQDIDVTNLPRIQKQLLDIFNLTYSVT